MGATLAAVLGPGRRRGAAAPVVGRRSPAPGWAGRAETSRSSARSAARSPRCAGRSRPGRRVLVLSAGAATPAEVAALLADRGWGDRALTVLEQLGGPARAPPRRHRPGLVAPARRPAERRRAGACARGRPRLGAHARPARRRLRPRRPAHQARGPRRDAARCSGRGPGELLWDVGAGSGSHRASSGCARTRPAGRSPSSATRRGRRGSPRNADALGRAGPAGRQGRAPDALAGLPTPDAVFIGGGLTRRRRAATPCWEALPAGGRLVANAVTWSRRRCSATVRAARRRADPARGGARRAGRRLHRLAPAMPVTDLVAWRSR